MKGKNQIVLVTALLILVLTLVSVSADTQKQLLCTQKGEVVKFSDCNPQIPDRTCNSDFGCQYCVTFNPDTGVYCPGNINVCNSNSFSCEFNGNASIDQDPPELAVYQPEEGAVYNDRAFDLDIQSNEKADLSYLTLNDPRGRWKQICNNCLTYGNRRSFEEGFNLVTFRAVDPVGNEFQVNRSFYIDSKDPRIRSTEPRRGFASGEFFAELDEANPVSLILTYGNEAKGFQNHSVDINSSCVFDRNYECTTNVDLSMYDGSEISYFFTLTDLAGSQDVSRAEELDVDIKFPIINSLNYEQDGRRVLVFLNITEAYFEEASYFLPNDPRAREKKLCSRLDNGICEGRISLDDGPQDIQINVLDQAGNSVGTSFSVVIDSKDPKIRGTEPRRGFASGLFEVEFDEANPVSLILTYGNSDLGLMNTSLDLDSDCFTDRNTICQTQVDLSAFDGSEIEYFFTIRDILNQTDVSRPEELDVDTTFPVLNNMFYTKDGRRVEFFFNITEMNFEEISYLDHSDSRPRERRLCSRLDDGQICEKSKTFYEGTHNLDIFIRDEAGNMIGTNLEIII